jgi:hypothetical protein
VNVRLLGAAGAVAALALSACGSSSAATLTKADWVTQANAICKDLNTRAEAIAPKSEADLGPAITKMAQLSAEDITKLAALKPPAEIQADVTTMVTAYQKVNQGFQDAAAKVAAGDTQGASTLMESATEAGKAGDTIATKLGATECSG